MSSDYLICFGYFFLQPNAYTYSVVLKALGEQGQWRLAEAIFSHLEQQVLMVRADAAIVKKRSAHGNIRPSQDDKILDDEPVLHASLQSHPLTLGITRPVTPKTSDKEFQPLGVWSSPSQLNGIHLDLSENSKMDSSHPQKFIRPQKNPANYQILAPSPSHRSLSQTVTSDGVYRTSFCRDLDNDTRSELPGVQSNLSFDFSKIQPNQMQSYNPPINEVVCGALMLSYERAGMWTEAISVIGRAQALGLKPNTIMFNTAISAAGKAGKLDLMERLYSFVPDPCAITHETVIVSYGMCGQPEKAEGILEKMIGLGLNPRCYAWCGLIAGYSLNGNFDLALVRQ